MKNTVSVGTATTPFVGTAVAISGDWGPGIELRVQRNHRAAVRFHENNRLDVVMKFPIGAGWVDDLQQRLERVRYAWPREVIQTAPRAYEWSPARRR